MKKRKRIKRSNNGEFHLPEAIIQHIQSFMNEKEAAQTSLLSKSWYSAWSTLPNLDFDEGIFFSLNVFWNMTRKTIRRYEEMKIHIESFSLYIMSGSAGDWYEEDMSMVEEVIVKAMKLGTTDFDFENDICDYDYGFVLPYEVFRSKTLIRLSVSGCDIDLGKERKVSCSGLKSLSLRNVVIGNDDLGVIVSSCPSIENFILRPGYANFVVYAPVNLYQLHNLKSLMFNEVDIDNSFFSDLTSKFPLLKDLSLTYCNGYTGIELSSRSLECLKFDQTHDLLAKCDVPNIRKFIFVGSVVPSLSFKTASREWESDICLSCDQYHGRSEWFLKLKKLMDCLSLSRITLSLHFSFGVEKNIEFLGLGKTVVESLKIHVPTSMPCDYLLLLKSIFQSCRPKIITEDWRYCRASNDFLRNLCNILKRVRGSGSSVFVVQGLKGVNVEVFEDNLAEWRPLPWKKLLDDLSTSEFVKKVRFRLTWRPEL